MQKIDKSFPLLRMRLEDMGKLLEYFDDNGLTENTS